MTTMERQGVLFTTRGRRGVGGSSAEVLLSGVQAKPKKAPLLAGKRVGRQMGPCLARALPLTLTTSKQPDPC